MATDGRLRSFEHHIDDMRALICCKICLKPFYEPFILHCGHTYCYGCLRHWFKNSLQTNRTQSCPDCRTNVAAEPSPNYVLRDLVHMFISRAELVSDGETIEEHVKGKAEEEKQISADKADRGLFGGVFARRARYTNTQAIADDEDRIMRCPECAWELEAGYCDRCGWDPDMYSEEDPPFSDSEDDLSGPDHESVDSDPMHAGMQDTGFAFPSAFMSLQRQFSPTHDSEVDDDDEDDDDDMSRDSELNDFIEDDEWTEEDDTGRDEARAADRRANAIPRLQADLARRQAARRANYLASNQNSLDQTITSDNESVESMPVRPTARRTRRPLVVSDDDDEEEDAEVEVNEVADRENDDDDEEGSSEELDDDDEDEERSVRSLGGVQSEEDEEHGEDDDDEGDSQSDTGTAVRVVVPDEEPGRSRARSTYTRNLPPPRAELSRLQPIRQHRTSDRYHPYQHAVHPARR